MAGLLTALTRPVRGIWLLRRLLVELRGLRRATERLADALELAAMASPTTAGRTFRSYTKGKHDLTDGEVKTLTEVAYVDDRVLGGMLAREEELRALLGRDPTEIEIERAYRGEVE